MIPIKQPLRKAARLGLSRRQFLQAAAAAGGIQAGFNEGLQGTPGGSPSRRAWPEPAAGEIRISGSDGAQMVYVPAGWFLRGSPPNEKAADPDERPQRRAYLDGFWIDRTEVTNRQYEKFVRATGYRLPLYWVNGKIPEGQEDYPAVGVSWEDARAYALWAGKDLPTEAQWEKAARGAEGGTFPWGNQWEPEKANLTGKLTRVGTHPGDVSPYGCLDMAGNAWEWCRDWYNLYWGYARLPDRNPTGVEDWRRYWYRGTHYRVVRGGYYTDGSPARSADRLGDVPPETRYWAISFRCAAAEVPQRANHEFQAQSRQPLVIKAPSNRVRPRSGRLATQRLASVEVDIDHPALVARSKGWENGDIGMYHYMQYFERLRDGTLLLSFGMHPDATGPFPPIDSANLGLGAVRVSKDGGKSWQKPIPPMVMVGRVLPDGRMFSLGIWQAEEALYPLTLWTHQGGTIQISDDDGKSISLSRRIFLDTGGLQTERIHCWAGGTLLMPEGEILAVAGCKVKGEDWWRTILLRWRMPLKTGGTSAP